MPESPLFALTNDIKWIRENNRMIISIANDNFYDS